MVNRAGQAQLKPRPSWSCRHTSPGSPDPLTFHEMPDIKLLAEIPLWVYVGSSFKRMNKHCSGKQNITASWLQPTGHSQQPLKIQSRPLLIALPGVRAPELRGRLHSCPLPSPQASKIGAPSVIRNIRGGPFQNQQEESQVPQFLSQCPFHTHSTSHCLLFQKILLNIAVRISVGRAWKSVLVTSFPRGFLSTLMYGNRRREVECKDGNAQA